MSNEVINILSYDAGRQHTRQDIIDKIEEMLTYDGMDVMPSKYALKMVQLYISRMDDNDEV